MLLVVLLFVFQQQICEGLEKTKQGIQQETKRYPTTKRESPAKTKENKRGAREGARPILGSNETNEEKEDDSATTTEEDTKSRRIPASVRGHHTDNSGTMVRA